MSLSQQHWEAVGSDQSIFNLQSTIFNFDNGVKMTLLRGFGGVDEDGNVALARNFVIHLGLKPNSFVSLSVMRIKGSGRKPYLIIHRRGVAPRLGPYETIFYQCLCRIDAERRMTLDDRVIEESEFEPGVTNWLEFKMVGPTNAPWLVIKSRGQRRLTSLQERMGVQPKSDKGISGKGKWNKKKWKVMDIEY